MVWPSPTANWIFSHILNILCKADNHMFVWENPSRSALSEICKSTSVAPNCLFPYSYTQFYTQLQQLVVTMSTCLNGLRGCHVIGWLYICINEQLNRCITKKVWVKSLNNLFVFIHAFILAVKMKRVLKLFRTYLKDPTIKLDWKETEKNQLDDHFSHKMNHLVC